MTEIEMVDALQWLYIILAIGSMFACYYALKKMKLEEDNVITITIVVAIFIIVILVAAVGHLQEVHHITPNLK